MIADGGESSPISDTRSGLVPAKGGAGKGRKQQSSLRSYFGFTAPAAPSPASPTSPAAPETPVQSQGEAITGGWLETAKGRPVTDGLGAVLGDCPQQKKQKNPR